jgi:hypothetical protein
MRRWALRDEQQALRAENLEVDLVLEVCAQRSMAARVWPLILTLSFPYPQEELAVEEQQDEMEMMALQSELTQFEPFQG